MEIMDLGSRGKFDPQRFHMELIHDMYTFRMILFSFEPGQELPVHHHEADSEVAILVLEGEGEFTGGEKGIPAKAGSLLVCKVSEPHGVLARSRMRVLVIIAPPI
ncbi:MAG: cupin domain-containing protein [bacterium]